MAQSIHISTARKMLESGDPVDIAFWTKDGDLIELGGTVLLEFKSLS